MRDGMFGITFQGRQGAGMGMLIFDNGRVYGTDIGGARYDGGYVFDENTRLVDVRVKVTFPPNVEAIFGICNPYEWAIDVTTTFDPRQNSGPLAVKTSLGQPISAQYVFLRNLPSRCNRSPRQSLPLWAPSPPKMFQQPGVGRHPAFTGVRDYRSRRWIDTNCCECPKDSYRARFPTARCSPYRVITMVVKG